MKNPEATTFQIVTPMFLGGVDHQATTIRPSSIKGALRFWWRALNWARCLREKNNEVDALRHLHDEEARLFGSAASDDGGGQGVFLMSVTSKNIKTVEQPFTDFQNKKGTIYLLGLGLAKYDKEKKETLLLRNSLQKGDTFTLKLLFRPEVDESDKQEIRNAVKALELLGALGSRARHGMGSIAGTKVINRDQYIAAVKELLQDTKTAIGEAPFTAFSAATRVDISAAGNDALALLNKIGLEQQKHRSYYGECNFENDHDDILRFIQGDKPAHHPERVVFGLPHNYHYSNGKGDASVNYAVLGANRKDDEFRRSSPLLLHVHPIQNDANSIEFIAVHTLMPAQFLPENAKIHIKIGKEKTGTPVQPDPDWDILRTYLNRYINNKIGITIHGNRK